MRKQFAIKKVSVVLLALALLATAKFSRAQVSATSQTLITNALSTASGVAIDPLGNLYVADGTTGLLSVSQGSTGAPSSLLSGLMSPGQVAVDANRNVYVANGTSGQVLEIPYQGGSLNLNGTILLGKGLGTVTGVAVDLSLNVYIVDSSNKQVVKISGTTQTTIATGLTAPKQVAVDRLGNVYIADAGANKVIYLPVGGGAAGTAGSGLNAPSGVAIDPSNNVYIADTGNGRVVEVPTAAGIPSPTVQNVLTTSIAAPTSLALDLRGGLYIASAGSVYRYTAGSIYFGLVPVATTSQTFPVTLTFTAAVAPATIKVVTTGITGLDYKDAGGSTCVAGTYAAGNTCVVNVSFTPGGVGPRYGAIVMYDVNNKVIARVFLGGGGLGAFLTVDPGTAVNVVPTNTAITPALLNTRGITADNAGNVFVADYNNNRILEIPAAQSTSTAATFTVALAAGGNSVSINGAGDLLIGSASTYVYLYPYENGTWSVADVITVGTGNTKARTVKTDVGGNIFWCDNGSGKLYENHLASATTAATQAQLLYTPPPTACLGVAVDLYGNLAAADSTTGKAFYAPATGATPYETGTGFTSTWGIAFDASGSIWINSDTLGTLGRIPNENGTLVGADQILSTVGGTKGYDIWVDPGTGNIYNTPTNGGTTPTNYYVAINRLQTTQNYPTKEPIGTTTTEIGTTASTTVTSPLYPIYLSNSGTLAPTYSNGGVVQLYDTADFPFIASAPAVAGTPSGSCAFSVGLAVGFTCDISNSFSPTSSGTRNETIEISSNAISNAMINLVGTSSSTVTGNVALSLTQTTPASGSPNPAQPLVFTVKATPTPASTTAATGVLTLTVDGVGFASATLSAGSATFSLPAGLALGTHTLGLTYSGDKNYNPITTSVNTTVTVVAATSTTTLVVSAANVDPNQNITLTASVPTLIGLHTPTGYITFKNAGVAIGSPVQLNAAGIANLTTSFASAGTETLTAVYGGDAVYNGSTSAAVTVTVGTYAATTTTLSLTPTQPVGGYVFGTALTFGGSVTSTSGTPTGTIDLFLDGAGFATNVPLSSGTYTVVTANIGAGTHSMVAYYSGTSTYDTSFSSTVSFTIIKATTATTLSISPTGTYASVAVTLTAQVSNVNVPASVPTGNVVFSVGAQALGTVSVSSTGSAVLTTTLLPAGIDSIKAIYSGDNNDQASTSATMTDTVTIVPTTTTLTGDSVITSGGVSTLTATVVGNPITGNYVGTVSFINGATILGTVNLSSGGVATFTTAALTAPATTICASYSGSSVYAASNSSQCFTIYVTNASGSGITATATLGTGLSSTAGTAVDISGNLYITDVTKGLVALIPGGSGTQSTVISSLATPSGLAVDGTGDLFIANGNAGKITKIPSVSGALVVSSATQLGTGLGTLSGVAVDTAGNVYAADATNKQLVKITPAGAQTTLSTTLTNPQQVAVDSVGDVYVADGTGNRVVFIPVTGAASTVGTGLLNPTGVAVDAYNNLYISDTGNNRVLKIVIVAGVPSTTQTVLIPTVAAPKQLAVDRRGALYIALGTSIYKWEANAASFGVIIPTTIAPHPSSPVYTLTFTFAQAITPASLNVLTAGVSGGAYALASGGTCAAGTAYTAGQSCTVNVTFTPVNAGITSGAVTFAASTGQPLITAYLGGVFYAPVVNFDTFTGAGKQLYAGTSVTTTTGGVTTTTNGVVNGVAVGTITGIAADTQGNVYVCDSTNTRIVQTTVAGGTGSVLYSGVGCGSVALDGAGNLIVDDISNSRMLLLPNENGTINGNDAYVVATGFNGPRGMTLDGFGNIVAANTVAVNVAIAPIGGAVTPQYTITNSQFLLPYDAVMDWQGNLAVANRSSGLISYLPASGAAATTVGSQFYLPVALAMDGSGAVFVADASIPVAPATCTFATCGENVVRVTPGSTFYDVVLGHTNTPNAVALDAHGNLYASYSSAFEVINRSNATPLMTFASTAVGSSTVASTDLGGASTATTAVITNGGPGPLTFTSSTGNFYFDSADFGLTTPGTATWLVNPITCNFSNQLGGGAGCTIGLQFTPVQAGTRNADYSPAGNEVNQPLLQLVGVGTGGSTLTATTITLAKTSPAGTRFPYTAITLATTVSGGTGTLTGTVSVTIDGVFIGQQAVAATLTFPDNAGLSPGFHSAVATYSGDKNNASSTVTVQLTAAGSTASASVLLVSPSTIVVLTPYNAPTGLAPYTSYTPVTLTATITGTAGGAVPTGVVEFLDGTTLLGTVKLTASGVAALVYTGGFLQGTHSITADYAGDNTYSTAISPVQTLTAIYPGDYSLALNPTSITITDGNTASIMLTTTPMATTPGGMYNGQVGFTCAGLPLYATCSFSPNTIYLDGSGAVATGVLTIITQAQFGYLHAPDSSSAIRLCFLPGASLLVLLGMSGLRRRRMLRSALVRNMIFVLALCGLLSPVLACGSHLPLAAAPGTYTLTVTGTGTGGINHTITMQVTLKQAGS